ncbi:MAG: DNA-binding protein [Thermoanaerobaculia bacterium]
MTTHQFTLIVEGPDLQTDASADALYDEGCDDALVGRLDGVQFLDFDREAPTLREAVLSAVDDAERVEGVEVVRLADAGLVSMADIANRTSRTRESVRLLIAGDRGPGGFPPPVTDPRSRYRLWRWTEVERWLTIHFRDDLAQPEDHILEAINAGLELRHHGRYVSRDDRRELQELVGVRE